MNQCKPAHMDTKENGKMSRRIAILEEVRVPSEDARGWKIKGQKRKVTSKEYKKFGRNFRLEVSWPTKDNGILPRRGCWKIEEFCPKKIAINCVKKKASQQLAVGGHGR